MKRAEILVKKYDYDFSEKYRAEIRELLEQELISYKEGSSEYLRFLCGFLFCIGNIEDIDLIRKVKYEINMDVGCMIDGDWLEESLEKTEREELVDQFVCYYKAYFK